MKPYPVVVILFLITSSALAQGTIEVGGSLQWLQPIVISIVVSVIGAASLWVAYYVQKLTGVKIEEAALNMYTKEAQERASGLVASGFVKLNEAGKITVPDARLAEAVNDVLKVGADFAVGSLDKADIAKKIVALIPMVPDTAVKPDGTMIAAPPAAVTMA